jgi:hypothetical protein
MALMFFAELEVRRSPSEKPGTSLSIGLFELTPPCKALLLAVSAACRKESRMGVLLCFPSDDGIAA